MKTIHNYTVEMKKKTQGIKYFVLRN